MSDGPERLALKYIELSQVRRWNRNKKRHDIGGLTQSFRLHGFKDPLKYEPELNNGEGGIVEGNGRDEALEFLFKEDPKSPPRGVILKDGDWLIPVLFGIDAPSQAAAEAYGYDHNNLTLLGGDFGLSDIMKMYDVGTDALLIEMAKAGEVMPVTVDVDAALAMQSLKPVAFDTANLPDIEPGDTNYSYMIYLTFSDEESFLRGLRALSFGERDKSQEGQRFAALDSHNYLERWETAIPGGSEGDTDPGLVIGQAETTAGVGEGVNVGPGQGGDFIQPSEVPVKAETPTRGKRARRVPAAKTPDPSGLAPE